jgi:hypothetical protein
MVSVANKRIMHSVIMLSVIMLNVLAPIVSEHYLQSPKSFIKLVPVSRHLLSHQGNPDSL